MATETVQPEAPTPANVAKLATESAHLDRTALLGIFGSVDSQRALIRLPHGNTQTVGLGDKVGIHVVVAIAEDQLVLSHGARQKILRMPRS